MRKKRKLLLWGHLLCRRSTQVDQTGLCQSVRTITENLFLHTAQLFATLERSITLPIVAHEASNDLHLNRSGIAPPGAGGHAQRRPAVRSAGSAAGSLRQSAG